MDELKLFTSRCNILLDPFLRLTDFLSTQRTATSATTRPALTVLFIRILFVLPIWILLTLPPLYILTTKRVVLAVGTVVLSWHSRPARVSRAILWRSRMVRRICVFLTGLDFGEPEPRGEEGSPPPLPPRRKGPQEIAASLAAKRRPDSPGVRFTFSIYENQRRWLGIGWTSSMLAYERASWTDEHLNPTPSKDEFELPEIEGGQARWRWVQGSEWKIDTGEQGKGSKNASGDEGWIYYDNGVSALPFACDFRLTRHSGKTAAAAKMAGAATLVVESGTATPNSLKSRPPLKSRPCRRHGLIQWPTAQSWRTLLRREQGTHADCPILALQVPLSRHRGTP